MKKFARVLVLLGITLGLGMVLNVQHADASTYHKGTPAAIRGHWRTKMEKVYNADKTFFWGYQYLTIKKNYFRDTAIQGGVIIVKHLKYRYAGNHTYYLKGKTYVGRDGFPFEWKIKKVNARKFKIKDLANSANSYRTWYKFSGRISKHLFYPYP